MEARIEIIAAKKLVGFKTKMSLANNKTKELWQKFMSVRNEVRKKLTNDFISMQVFDPSVDFKDFNQRTEFEKWATIEVANFEFVPNEMETFILSGGLYAVFVHKGTASDGPKTFQYIFQTWIPESDYLLDNSRAHFEILGAKYKNDDPDSEEEIWIPIKPK